jgi:hypothetical protein
MSEAKNKYPWVESPEDPHASALFETWAAFSDLLENSQPSLDEPLLVATVLARVAHRERSRRRWIAGGVGLAIAATLLIAVSLMRLSRDGSEVALAPQIEVAGGGAASESEVADRITAPQREVDPSLAWDDNEWNNSLAAVHQEALQLQNNWRQPTDALTNFQNRLDAFQQEIEDSSL